MADLQNVKQRFGIIGMSEGVNRSIEKSLRVAPTDISVGATLKDFSIDLLTLSLIPIIPNLCLTFCISAIYISLEILKPLPINVALVQFSILTSTKSPGEKFFLGKTTTVF